MNVIFVNLLYMILKVKLFCDAANERGMWMSYKDLHHGEFLRNVKIMKLDGVS